jgi:hypothetical protein
MYTKNVTRSAWPTANNATLLALLTLGLLSACGDDPAPSKPKPRPQPDMTVTADMPIDTPPDVDESPDTDTSPDVDTPPDVDMPDMEPDLGPQCMTNADCDPGNHCDEGQCLPGACREADKNACGGCAPLAEAPGDACGQCMKDQLACAAGGESLECNGDTPCSAPTVRTDEPANITQYTATLAGAVLDAGDGPVTEHGFCYGKTMAPAIGGMDIICSTLGALAQPADFTEELANLELGTSYFVRAYATNNIDTSYGEERELRTADALLPQVQTLTVTSPADGEVSVDAQLDELGVPEHDGHGVCLGAAADPALGDGSSNCTDLGLATQTGPFTVAFTNLELGATYHVRAFARSDAGTSYGQDLSITLRPTSPEIKTITNGTITSRVTLTWDPVPGATGYKVYRDGVAITPQAIPDLTLDDITAAAGGVPTNVGLNPSATSDNAARVTLSWSAGTAPQGTSYDYTLTAINTAGESDASQPKQGARAAQPITGYEVTVNGGNPIAVNGLNYDDTTAPAGVVTQANASASKGASSSTVFLNLDGADPQPGAPVNYRVRAKNAAGAGQDSDVFQGAKGPATLNIQWQRSSSTTDANYSNLAGATGRTFNDTTGPANEIERFYRVVITGGPMPITTAGDIGFRSANNPELLVTSTINVTQTNATIKGTLTSLGTSPSISPYGYCWSTSANPTYAAGSTNCSVGAGSRNTTGPLPNGSAAGLTAGTTYYVRAFGVFMKGGQATTVYSPNYSFVTRPNAVTTLSASTNDSAKVRLAWINVAGATEYKVLRNGSVIATVPAGNVLTSYDDTAAPAPPVPSAPASATLGTKYCTFSNISWTAAPAPGDGADATYTIVATNASGDAPASVAKTGRRDAAPILGYKVINASNGNATTTHSEATRSNNVFTLRTPTITPGTVTASDAAIAHPTYVRLDITGASQTTPPNDVIRIVAYNAIGDGAARSVTTSRAVCTLITQWQSSSSSGGTFTNISGATSDPYDDGSAPANGATVYYRANVYTAGSSNAQLTNVNQGRRYTRQPSLTTNTQNANARGRTSFSANYKVNDFGIPAVTTAEHGLCISTSNPPVKDQVGTTCRAANSNGCGFLGTISGNPINTGFCEFTGLTPNSAYYIRAWARSATTANAYIYGDSIVHTTNP